MHTADKWTELNMPTADKRTEFTMHTADKQTELNMPTADKRTELNIHTADKLTESTMHTADKQTELTMHTADKQRTKQNQNTRGDCQLLQQEERVRNVENTELFTAVVLLYKKFLMTSLIKVSNISLYESSKHVSLVENKCAISQYTFVLSNQRDVKK
ncbi:hypothetical protein PoB_004199000 [Plakobranchus ocellatus]|uniref:Uncharacterized protein n=1 Tax=Plakobranchus ocellatus TaxID=259542 RepID=A0AAV4B7H3_9GAST|nr:hypothetical protein PoB_004199000 [Plakobranchus ocellatus]